MNCGDVWRSIFPSIALCAVCLLAGTVYAQTATPIRVSARFTPETGRISDVAILGDYLILAYPDAGRLAQYTLAGELVKHIKREGGAARRFRPTACLSRGDTLLVFDEAEHKLFTVQADGNFTKGVDLAYPSGEHGALIALSRIGGLTAPSQGPLWVLLPERGVLATFDSAGTYQQAIDLAAQLPYPAAVYSRAVILSDGSLFALDYHQGAVLYRRGNAGAFKRLRLGSPEGLDAAPVLQDFAVDEYARVLLATHDAQAPLVFLTPAENAYHSHLVELNLPADARLACRASQGKVVVWQRDQPLVVVLELAAP